MARKGKQTSAFERYMQKTMNADSSPRFNPAGMPKLKPCPDCVGLLEYWDERFVACTNPRCGFTAELPRVKRKGRK